MEQMTIFRGGETHARRIIGTLDTFVISWVLTSKLSLAGSIAGLELFTKIGWYYFHHHKKVRFFATVDLVNALEQEKAANKRASWPNACCVSTS
jgi:uncharacterized membrane protein